MIGVGGYVMGRTASLIYASENGYRVFDESNCEELTPVGIQNGVNELRARAWSRENLMRLAPNSTTLMQMLSPDWSDWGWKVAPEYGAETRKVRRLAAYLFERSWFFRKARNKNSALSAKSFVGFFKQ